MQKKHACMDEEGMAMMAFQENLTRNVSIESIHVYTSTLHVIIEHHCRCRIF
jgi:hypothetical protein